MNLSATKDTSLFLKSQIPRKTINQVIYPNNCLPAKLNINWYTGYLGFIKHVKIINSQINDY